MKSHLGFFAPYTTFQIFNSENYLWLRYFEPNFLLLQSSKQKTKARAREPSLVVVG